MLLLCRYDLLGYVDGSYPCPPDGVLVQNEDGCIVLVPDLEHHAWNKHDQAVMSTIISSLTLLVFVLMLFINST
jgi:hypothetical protein